MTLVGKTVVLTGASSGIGAQAVAQLAGKGATVCLLARRADLLADVVEGITRSGGCAQAYPVDLTDADETEAVVKQLLVDHPRIDVLINNAARSIRRPIRESLDRVHDFERTMAINYVGAVRLTLALLPRFLEQGDGHVVFSSTMSTQLPIPLFSAYLASKAAVESFARSLNAELGDGFLHQSGVTTTIVHFPMVRTEMSSATPIYSAMPMMSANQAAAWLVRAADKRPAKITSASGAVTELATTAVPGLVTATTRPLFRTMDHLLARRSRR